MIQTKINYKLKFNSIKTGCLFSFFVNDFQFCRIVFLSAFLSCYIFRFAVLATKNIYKNDKKTFKIVIEY